MATKLEGLDKVVRNGITEKVSDAHLKISETRTHVFLQWWALGGILIGIVTLIGMRFFGIGK